MAAWNGFIRVKVAPLAGAWIEIVAAWNGFIRVKKSLPSRGRGLKFMNAVKCEIPHTVAPLAGAWIEITNRGRLNFTHRCRSPRGGVD